MKFATIAVGVAILGAACSSSASTPTEAVRAGSVSTTASAAIQSPSTAQESGTTETTESQPDGLDDLAREYFAGIEMYEAIPGTFEPGSHADDFAYFSQSLSTAQLNRGQVMTGSIFKSDGDTIIFEQGVRGQWETEPSETSTITFSGVEVSPSGVADFAIDGRPLSEVMARISEPIDTQQGIVVERALLYVSSSGFRIAMLVLKNDTDMSFDPRPGSAQLVQPDGTQVEGFDSVGRVDIRPGGRVSVFSLFDDSSDVNVGTMYFNGFFEDISQVKIELSLERQQ